MNKMFKRTLNFVVMAVFALTMNIVAFAQGTTMIAVSKNSPAVGESVTVSVTASESGTVTVKYTSSMLNYVSCNASGASASGNTVTFSGTSGDIVFNVGSAGTASIIVSSSSCSGSSTTLAIGSGSASQPEPAPQEQATSTTEITEEETPAATDEAPAESEAAEAPVETTAVGTSGAVGTLNGNGGFDINGVSYVVSERYSDNEMPSGFSKKTIQIGSSTYSEPTNGNITLLYLKPADNTSGSGVFYLYNAEAQTVSEFLMLDASNDLVIISTADSAPSSAFTQTGLEVSGGTTTAYTIDGSEFFYVYGTNKAGATGWFVYDSTNKTVSRMDESLLSTTATASADDEANNSNDSVDVYVNKLDTYRKVIMALIVLCVILVFIVINTLLKSKGKDDDDFDGDVFASRPSKPAKRLPRSIVFGGSSKKNYDEEEFEDEEVYDDEEYDEDEADEEEYDDASPSISESVSSYEARRNSSLNMMDLNDL